MAKVELKQPIVDQISETVKDAKAVMIVKYLGLTVEEDTAMRKELRENDITYKVFKNTLMNRAFQGTDLEPLCKDLEGGNALVVSKEDPTKPANILAKYAKKYKPLSMVSGMIDGQYADEAKLQEVADIPSRDILLGRLLGSMQSPITNFARVLKQIAEKDGEAAPEAEAAPAE